MVGIVATNLSRIIEKKGYKKSAIARKANMKPQDISDILAGRKVIRADHIPLLAHALEVEPNDLFKEE